MITETAPATAALWKLHAYADGMRDLSTRFAHLADWIAAVGTKHPHTHPVFDELRDELRDAVVEFVRVGSTGVNALLFQPESGDLWDAAHETMGHVMELEVSHRWIGFVPGTRDPNDPDERSGWANAEQVVAAVVEDLTRQSEECAAMAARVRKYALKQGAR